MIFFAIGSTVSIAVNVLVASAKRCFKARAQTVAVSVLEIFGLIISIHRIGRALILFGICGSIAVTVNVVVRGTERSFDSRAQSVTIGILDVRGFVSRVSRTCLGIVFLSVRCPISIAIDVRRRCPESFLDFGCEQISILVVKLGRDVKWILGIAASGEFFKISNSISVGILTFRDDAWGRVLIRVNLRSGFVGHTSIFFVAGSGLVFGRAIDLLRLAIIIGVSNRIGRTKHVVHGITRICSI